MKDTIIVILWYCVIFIGTVIVTAFLFSITQIGLNLPSFPVIKPGYVFAIFPQALLQMLLPSALFALFVASVRMRRKPGIRIISYAALASLSMILLLSGPATIRTMINPRIVETLQTEELSYGLRDLVYPNSIIATREGSFYFEEVKGSTLSSVIHINNTGNSPRISAYRSVSLSLAGRRPEFFSPDGKSAFSVSPRSEEVEPFKPGPTLEGIFGMLTPLGAQYLTLSTGKYEELVILSALLVALVLSSSVFLRLSRWLSANIMFMLTILYLLLVLYSSVALSLVSQAREVMGDNILLTLIPYALLAFFSGLFFIFDFILFPMRRSSLPDA
ncbi:MAG: hypothetical protein EHM28_01330 [Spirochaetaceae bacterium]|nr:MAG: hypothetical protein EHM28_01330 [Spirochaetaceae bacterium]